MTDYIGYSFILSATGEGDPVVWSLVTVPPLHKGENFLTNEMTRKVWMTNKLDRYMDTYRSQLTGPVASVKI